MGRETGREVTLNVKAVLNDLRGGDVGFDLLARSEIFNDSSYSELTQALNCLHRVSQRGFDLGWNY